jgi:hypothetical protein
MKKVILYFTSFAIVAFFLWTTYLWKFFKSNFAGSYPYAETWSIHANQNDVIKAIRDLKRIHPDLDPINKPSPNYRTVRYWYLENFHYRDTDEDIEVYLRPTEDSFYTIVGLTMIGPHQDTLTPIEKQSCCSDKEINKDFGYFEDRRQIRRFEEKILVPLTEKLNVKYARR